ncbi:unnamed protein product [Allacma fusca]|uniref:Arf-GAP domain-containing protein n=1 Tax=Allacma fusca TaxID=39272 RepID=A0A8J2PBK9_9HEXA|nr:unnamed protein product [Allacma fusca]
MGESLVVNIACGDCGSADCHWASISRGLYLCNECSFIHRTLGPQYSRIKSLKHSKWHANLRQMVGTLALGPANNVWEHTLLNPSKSDLMVKKPVAGDSLEVVKKRFITLKHCQFQFVLRQKQDTFDVRNEELHSTVRTSDIGTALRLIASGADPNFFHPERGTRPLHVACRSGQSLQVELLFVHGAQIDAPDYLGQTPADHAKAAGFKDLAVRIEELQYHLTDQLSLFACGESPDHASSKHVLIPSMGSSKSGQEEKIKLLPSQMLEQLTSDLYDEVDRRQAEKILISSSPEHARFSIAFLPVNPNFPSVRNQTRQKFARLTDSEMSSLIIAILRESKRRHLNAPTIIEPDQDIFLDNNLPHCENAIQSTILNEDDEFPLYDSVASDDDIVMSEVQTIQPHKPEVDSKESNLNSTSSSVTRNTTDSPYLTRLAEERIAQLETSNLMLKYELKVIKQMLSSYIQSSMEKSQRLPPSLTEMDHLNSNNLESSDAVGRNNFRSSGNVVMRQHSPSELSSHLKKFRSVSMYAEKINPPDGSEVVARPNTSGESTPTGRKENETSALVQATTRDIVELIKILIEFAGANDYQGVHLTANKVYDAAQGMAAVLMEKEADTNIKNGLHNVIVQVLRMKSEIPLLSNSQLLNAATLNYNSEAFKKKDSGSELYVQKVKQLCFDVGAAMKLLVSTIVS